MFFKFLFSLFIKCKCFFFVSCYLHVVLVCLSFSGFFFLPCNIIFLLHVRQQFLFCLCASHALKSVLCTFLIALQMHNFSCVPDSMSFVILLAHYIKQYSFFDKHTPKVLCMLHAAPKLHIPRFSWLWLYKRSISELVFNRAN